MFVLPINKDNPVRAFPAVFILLVLINGIVLIATYFYGSTPQAIFLKYGFIPAEHRPITILTSIFLHSGFWHYAGNMFFLWMFGARVENMLGKALYLFVYLLCGAGGAYLHFMFDPTSTIPCVGASGAISGIGGVFFVLFPRARFDLVFYLGWIRLGSLPARTYGAVGAWIAEQTLLGFLTQFTHFSSVAFWAHVGGFVTGVAAAFLFVSCVPDSLRRDRERWYIQE